MTIRTKTRLRVSLLIAALPTLIGCDGVLCVEGALVNDSGTLLASHDCELQLYKVYKRGQLASEYPDGRLLYDFRIESSFSRCVPVSPYTGTYFVDVYCGSTRVYRSDHFEGPVETFDLGEVVVSASTSPPAD